jgi:hypothetical protein
MGGAEFRIVKQVGGECMPPGEKRKAQRGKKKMILPFFL